MISAFGVDHGGDEVSKIANPLGALRTFGGAATGGVKAAMGAGTGARRATGMAALPKPAEAFRSATGGLGARVSGGLKSAGARISGAPGKRAAPGLRQKAGGALTGLGQKTFARPVATGAATLGAGGAAAGAGGVAAFGGRRRQP